jgi:hypothetical protein
MPYPVTGITVPARMENNLEQEQLGGLQYTGTDRQRRAVQQQQHMPVPAGVNNKDEDP